MLVQVDADVISILLPNIVQGLRKDATQDFQMATHMILAQLCSHAILSEALLKGRRQSVELYQATALWYIIMCFVQMRAIRHCMGHNCTISYLGAISPL